MQSAWLEGDGADDPCGTRRESDVFQFTTAEKWMLDARCTTVYHTTLCCVWSQSLFLGGFPYNVRRDFPSGVVNVVDLTTEFIARGDMTQGRR